MYCKLLQNNFAKQEKDFGTNTLEAMLRKNRVCTRNPFLKVQTYLEPRHEIMGWKLFKQGFSLYFVKFFIENFKVSQHLFSTELYKHEVGNKNEDKSMKTCVLESSRRHFSNILLPTWGAQKLGYRNQVWHYYYRVEVQLYLDRINRNMFGCTLNGLKSYTI